MTDGSPGTPTTALVERAKNILMKPRDEWARIDTEPATIGGLYTSWVLILAAIPAIAGLIGTLLVGQSFMGVRWTPSPGFAIGLAVTQYAMALAGVFLLALIIDWLAPSFGGQRNRIQAFKVAAYAATAAWLAGIFAIIPALSFLGLLGLYSLYLLFTGLPLLMKAPEDKALGYTVVTIVAAFVLMAVLGAITMPVARMFGGGMPPDANELSGSVTVPGVGKIDLDKIQPPAE